MALAQWLLLPSTPLRCWAEIADSVSLCPRRGENVQERLDHSDYADKPIAALRHPEPDYTGWSGVVAGNATRSKGGSGIDLRGSSIE